MMWQYGFGPNMMWGAGFGIIPVILSILFWIIVVWGIVALVHYLIFPHDYDDDDQSLTILRERYAKGEIDKKQFEELKKDLS